jgi:hypothetical protein
MIMMKLFMFFFIFSVVGNFMRYSLKQGLSHNPTLHWTSELCLTFFVFVFSCHTEGHAYHICLPCMGQYSLCHLTSHVLVVEMVICVKWWCCGTKPYSYSYLFLHWVHLNGVSSLWMVRCSCRIPFEVKLCPHWSHTNGRSPKWTAFKWADTADLLLNLVT